MFVKMLLKGLQVYESGKIFNYCLRRCAKPTSTFGRFSVGLTKPYIFSAFAVE